MKLHFGVCFLSLAVQAAVIWQLPFWWAIGGYALILGTGITLFLFYRQIKKRSIQRFIDLLNKK